MRELNLAILEHSTDLHPSLIEKYSALIGAMGYSIQPHCFTTETLLRKFLLSKVVSLVVCDLSLGEEQDMAGLHVVSSLKKDFPEIFVIGNSQHAVSYRNTAARMPTFDLFVDKGLLLSAPVNDRRYIPELRAQIEAGLRVTGRVDISQDSYLPEPLAKRRRDVESLLAQVFSTDRPDDRSADINTVKLVPLSGGRSKSFVFKVDGWNTDTGLAAVPSVLKISPREDAQKELSNYHKYVKWLLPYTWRVDVLGTGQTKEYGAIAYSFILSGSQPIDSLTSYLRAGDSSTAYKVIEDIFSPDQQKWYAPAAISSAKGLNEHYRQLYFPTVESISKLDDAFKFLVQKHVNGRVEPHLVRAFGETFRLPQAALFGKPHQEYLSCICHGDLNSNNIIVAKNGAVIFIDFQNTGRAHVFADFVNAEMSIRAYYELPENGDTPDGFQDWLRDAFKSEMVHFAGSQDEYSQLISTIRTLAQKNFPDEDFAHYYYAVAVQGCRLMRSPTMSFPGQARILLGVLAAIKQL